MLYTNLLVRVVVLATLRCADEISYIDIGAIQVLPHPSLRHKESREIARASQVSVR